MDNVLITGASGFIAPHIINECLKKKYKVFGIDIVDEDKDFCVKDENFFFEKKNVLDLDINFLKKIKYVFHLAFVTNIPNTIKNPLDTTKDNLNMTVDLLKKSSEAGVKKFLLPSTGSLYGNNPVPWNENMMADTIEPYSFQKLSCNNIFYLLFFQCTLNAPVTNPKGGGNECPKVYFPYFRACVAASK